VKSLLGQRFLRGDSSNGLAAKNGTEGVVVADHEEDSPSFDERVAAHKGNVEEKQKGKELRLRKINEWCT